MGTRNSNTTRRHGRSIDNGELEQLKVLAVKFGQSMPTMNPAQYKRAFTALRRAIKALNEHLDLCRMK